MKRTTIAAGMLLGSSFGLGCSVHAGMSANAPPPPQVVVEGQVGAQAEVGGQAEVVVQGEPPPPPPPQPETVPASPGVEFTWIGGYHRWDGHSYVWVGGRYEHRPHPDSQWRAAHWEARGSGHAWVEGGWDGQAGSPPAEQPQPVAVQGQADVGMAPPPETEPEELIATSEPPDPVYEEQTDAPSPGMVWVGGYWQWTGSDWSWYYGRWNTAPQGRIYVEPYYERDDSHVVYVRGYWGTRGEAPRYYGGDRIVFAAAVRPAGYRRGDHELIARSTGVPPGHRAGHYGPKPTGSVKARPLPMATAPREPVPRAEPEIGARAETGTKLETGGANPGTVAKPVPVAKPGPAAKPEPKAPPKPAPRPKPKR